jgi:hypothetical protein
MAQRFICKKCGHSNYWVSARNLYICTQCEHNHSLTAGTIMDSSKKPITYWFKAMWWFTTRKSEINAVNLKELLGFSSYGTAWCWLQKRRRCTIRQDRKKLSERVEVDEFFIGGQKSGKRGRGADGIDFRTVAGNIRISQIIRQNQDNVRTLPITLGMSIFLLYL